MQKPSTAGRKPFKAERYIGLVFIAPWIIGFLVFQLYPFVSSFIYSFTSFNIIGKRNNRYFDIRYSSILLKINEYRTMSRKYSNKFVVFIYKPVC